MTTVTVDLLDDKAINLLKDLEALNIIRVGEIHKNDLTAEINSFRKYKGQMTKQSVEEIEKQFKDLRDEWD